MFCCKSNQYRWFAAPASIWIDFAQAMKRQRRSTTRCRAGDRIHTEKPFLSLGAESCKVRHQPEKTQLCIIHQRGKPRKKLGLDPPSGEKGEEAKGRLSHIGRAILSQLAGLRDDLLQYIIRNTKNPQIRSSKVKQLSVSKWSKLEHLISHRRFCDP